MVQNRRDVLQALQEANGWLTARQLSEKVGARISTPLLRSMYNDGLLESRSLADGRGSEWSISEGGRAILDVLTDREGLTSGA